MTAKYKLLLLLFLFSPLLASAQSNGYYRLKNKATGQYVSLASDVLDYDKVLYDIGVRSVANDKTGARATMIEKMNCYLEHDIHLTSTQNTNPASVFYLKTQSSKDKTFDLLSEGTNLYDITTGVYTGSSSLGTVPVGGFYCTIKSVSGNTGLYTIHIPVKVSYKYIITISKNLGDFYFKDFASKFGIEKDASKQENAQWYLEKATTFNVAPLSKVKDREGHYWTTLCVDFPFTIPANGSTVLGAYTVVGKDADGYAVLSELSGTIAGGTPCLIECSSDDATTNILNIETAEPASKSCADGEAVSSDNNYLQGRYFNAPSASYQYLNTYKSPSVTESLGVEQNVLKNDKTHFRVLNCVDGVVGFYKLKNANSTMGANKAFLNIQNLPTVATSSAKVFALEDLGEATGIHQAEAESDHSAAIYDLQGRRVSTITRHGIYIINGKKVVR